MPMSPAVLQLVLRVTIAAALAVTASAPSVLAQDCSTYLGPVNVLPGLHLSEDIALADLDGDGLLDLGLLHQGDFEEDPGWLLLVRGLGAGRFATGVEVLVGVQPTAVAAGDLDGDGWSDLVVTNQGSASLSVLLSEAAGVYAAPVTYATNSDALRSAEVAELTGDGALDVVVYSADTSAALLLFAGQGDGSLASPQSVPLVGGYGDLELVDIDGDGHLDLLLFNASANAWLRGHSDGSFDPEQLLPVGTLLDRTRFTDVDQDGLPDLLSLPSAGVLQLRLGLGAAAFGPMSAILVPPLAQPGPMRLGDLDEDGQDDLLLTSERHVVPVLIAGGRLTPLPPQAVYNSDGFQVPAQRLLADVEGDGRLDLLELRAGQNRDLVVRPGLGDGTFLLPQALDLPDTRSRAVALLHLDGDGFLDAVVTDVASDRLWTLLNAGDGTLLPDATHALGDRPIALAVADLDADGFTDVVVANSDSDDLSLLAGNGDGTLAPAIQRACGPQPEGLALADLTGDGLPDIAVANHFANTLTVLRNLGGLTFTGAGILPVGAVPTGVAIADLDGNGWPDLVTANQNPNPGDISVVLRNASGQFLPAVQYATLNSNRDLALGDVNRDGLLDVVVSTSEHYFQAPAVKLMLGQPGGSFVASSVVPQTLRAGFVETGDVDGDGRLDVVVGNGLGSLSWLTGSGAAPWLAPVSSHGLLGFCRQIAVGDLDNDGVLDVVAATDVTDLELGSPLSTADVSVLLGRCAPVWSDLGHALAGTPGELQLHGVGPLVGGAGFQVQVANALPLAPVWIFGGVERVDVPFFGGTLVPQFVLPAGTFVGFSADGTGERLLLGTMPGALAGFEFFLQLWSQDGGAPFGYSASRALGTTIQQP